MYSLMMVGLLTSHSDLLGRMRVLSEDEAVARLLLDLGVVVATARDRSGTCVIVTTGPSPDSGPVSEPRDMGGGVGIMAERLLRCCCFVFPTP